MKDIRIHFDEHNLFEVALIGALVYALWTIGDFLLVLGAGLIVSTFIEDFVVRGLKYKIPRAVSVIAFYVVAFMILIGVFVFVVPVMTREIADLALIYPEIGEYLADSGLVLSPMDSFSIQGFLDVLQDAELRDALLQNALNFFGGVVNALIVFVVSFYLSIQANGIDHALRIFTPLKYEEKVVSFWHRVQRKIGSWFRGQLLIAVILTVLTYAGLFLGGVPYAFLLSVLAGVFGLVPYGIFLALIPAVVIGFIQGGLVMAVGVAVGYVLLQQVLDLGLQPLIVNKLTGVPSLVVIISVFIGAELFGLYGLLLAMPIALFVMELIAESEKHKSQEREPLISSEQMGLDLEINKK